ncbi:MAG: hypothetical protein Q9168_005866 [Polycauliona sp. 1 TL-2023]
MCNEGGTVSLYDCCKKEQSLVINNVRHENEDLRVKNQALHNEIDELREHLSGTIELERELKELRETTESKRAIVSNGSSSISEVLNGSNQWLNQIQDKLSPEQEHLKYQQVEHYHQKFVQCSSELERVKQARATLESTCRTWKEKYRQLSLQQYREIADSHSGKGFVRPGAAPVAHSGQDPDVLASTDLENASRVSDGVASLSESSENYSATPGARIDQDDAETSDESEHLTAIEDGAKIKGLTDYEEVITTNSQIKRSQSEEPIFVSETAVNVPAKRKRDKSPANTLRRQKLVKEEILSSSPVAPSARPNAAAVQESIDLDEITGNIYTPRKDKSKRQQLYGTRSLSPSIQRMLDARPSIKVGSENHNIQIDTEMCDLAIHEDEKELVDGMTEMRDDAYYKRLGEEHAARARDADKWNEVEKRRAKQKLHNERQLSKNKDTKKGGPRVTQQRHTGMQDASGTAKALQPSDANAALPRTGDILSNKKRRTKRPNDHGFRHVQELAEDGETMLDRENQLLDGDPQEQAVISEKSVEALAFNQGAETRARLDHLLTRQSPEKPRLHARDKKAQAAHVSNISDPPMLFSQRVTENTTPKTPNLEREDRSSAKTPRNPMSAAARALKPLDTPNYRSPFAQSSSKKKPSKLPEPSLRSRPLSQLALDDFKINPNQNQGYDYAFKETVRKQDQRKCLPGCTRLDCCGAIFRKMAATMANHFYHTSRLNGSSSQEYDEQGMMADYLGEDQVHRLKNMSRDQKAEVLLRAKTKIMADHYGRHREVFAREPSPVGYWDVDMPNSQEAAEMGRMAAMRTRGKVEERYQEAVKRDGTWKFRDE